MNRLPRLDYDQIAHLYDSQPYRARATDPDGEVGRQAWRQRTLAFLDIACGTGDQLIANNEAEPDARLVGGERTAGAGGSSLRRYDPRRQASRPAAVTAASAASRRLRMALC